MNGSSFSVCLPLPVYKAIRAFSAEHGVSLFVAMLTGFAALIARYSGETDILIGSGFSNRRHINSERIVGMLVNTVVLRCDVPADSSFQQVLRGVQRTVLEAYDNQEFPIDETVAMLNPERVLEANPLFRYMFSFHDSQFDGPAMNGVNVQVREGIATGGSKTDLNVIVVPYSAARKRIDCSADAEGIRVTYEYHCNLFGGGVIERMAMHYQRMLEAMIADAEQSVAGAALLTASERDQVLYEWNNTKTAFRADKCVHQWFEEQVEKTPDAPAVVFEDASLNYAELNRRANRLAHYLRELGLKPDDRVALCLERGFEMIVGLLAVLKAGGAYVPLDPAYPADRLRFMVEDSAPLALLTQSHFVERFSGFGGSRPILDLSNPAPPWQRSAETNPDPHSIGLTSRHLAYVIYTSGSTGLPKGVLVEHTNVVRLFLATDEWFHLSADDVWTLFHSYAFDFSVWEIFGALLYGGCLIVVAKDIARSPDDFYKLICRERVTILNQTPTAFRQMIAAQSRSIDSHSLRHVVFGGEALEVAALTPWYKQERNQNTQLINMYGITETTIHVTYRALDQEDTFRHGASPIGCPLPDLFSVE
jgi:amino acid adenylation domain-containing protein